VVGLQMLLLIQPSSLLHAHKRKEELCFTVLGFSKLLEIDRK